MSSKLIGFFQSITGKADSVLTTKADLATYSTTRIRLGVGSNDTVLTADSSEATGLKWAAVSGSWVGTATSILAMSKYQINYGDEESSTISSGSVALDGMLFQKVDTEGSASSDDLNTLSSTQVNSFLILGANNNGRTVVIKDGGGNMLTAGDFSLDSSHDRILFEANSAATYVEISRSDNLA